MKVKKIILISAIVCLMLCAFLIETTFCEPSHCVLCEAAERDIRV